MNIKLMSAAAAAALTFSGAQAFAATVVFDSFTNNQLAVDEPVGGDLSSTTTQTVTVAGDVNVDRTLTATNQNDRLLGTQMQIDGGFLSFSNIARAQGAGTLNYDFGTNYYNLLAGLSDNPYFLFDIQDFDGQANFNASIIDSDGTEYTYSEVLLDNVTIEEQLFFSAFMNANSGNGDDNLNFGEVASLTFSIASLNTDVAIDGSIGPIRLGDVAPVPLPASGLLLLAGMGGMSLLRRRRKA